MSLPNGQAAPYIIQNGNIYQLATTSTGQMMPRNAIQLNRIDGQTPGGSMITLTTANDDSKSSSSNDATNSGTSGNNVILSLANGGEFAQNIDQNAQFQVVNATTASSASGVKFTAIKASNNAPSANQVSLNAVASAKTRKIIYKAPANTNDAQKPAQIQFISNVASQPPGQPSQFRTINLFQPQTNLAQGLGPSQAKQIFIANNASATNATKLSAIINNPNDLKAGKVLLSAAGTSNQSQSSIFVLRPNSTANGGTISTATLPNGQNVQFILQPKQLQMLQAAQVSSNPQISKVYRPITSNLSVIKPAPIAIQTQPQSSTASTVSPSQRTAVIAAATTGQFDNQQGVQYFLSADGTELIPADSQSFNEMAFLEALNAGGVGSRLQVQQQQQHVQQLQADQLSGTMMLSTADFSKTTMIRQQPGQPYLVAQTQQQSMVTTEQKVVKATKTSTKASKIREITKTPAVTPVQRQPAAGSGKPKASATSSSTTTTNINNSTNNTNIIINNNTNNIIINNNTNNIIINNSSSSNFTGEQQGTAEPARAQTRQKKPATETAPPQGATECTISIKDSIKRSSSENASSSDKSKRVPLGEGSIEDCLNEFILPDTRIFASLMNKDTNSNANNLNKRSQTDFTYKSVMIGNTEHIILDNANNLSDFQGDLHKLKEIACALASKLNKPVTIPAFLLLQEASTVERIREFLNEKNINPIIIDTNSTTTCNTDSSSAAAAAQERENQPAPKPRQNAKDPALKKALKAAETTSDTGTGEAKKSTISKSNSKRKLSQSSVTPPTAASTKPASKRPRQRKSTVTIANSIASSEGAEQSASQVQTSSQSSSVAESCQQYQQLVVNPSPANQEASSSDDHHQQQIEQFAEFLNDQVMMQQTLVVNAEPASGEPKADANQFESYDSFKIDFIDDNYSNMNQAEYNQPPPPPPVPAAAEGLGILNSADFCLDSLDPNGFFNLNMNDLTYTNNLYQNS